MRKRQIIQQLTGQFRDKTCIQALPVNVQQVIENIANLKSNGDECSKKVKKLLEQFDGLIKKYKEQSDEVEEDSEEEEEDSEEEEEDSEEEECIEEVVPDEIPQADDVVAPGAPQGNDIVAQGAESDAEVDYLLNAIIAATNYDFITEETDLIANMLAEFPI